MLPKLRQRLMTKNKRPTPGESPSLLFYFFILGIAGFAVYKQRFRLYEHLLPIAVGVIFVGIVVVILAYRRWRLTGSLSEIDNMSGHDFERYLTRLFKRLGFKSKNIGASGGDFGADLIIEKDGVRIAVQAKNYCRGRVGNDAVQQAIAGATFYECHQAMVVTNARFTKAARVQAEGCTLFPVTLWDRRDLTKVLRGL